MLGAVSCRGKAGVAWSSRAGIPYIDIVIGASSVRELLFAARVRSLDKRIRLKYGYACCHGFCLSAITYGRQLWFTGVKKRIDRGNNRDVPYRAPRTAAPPPYYTAYGPKAEHASTEHSLLTLQNAGRKPAAKTARRKLVHTRPTAPHSMPTRHYNRWASRVSVKGPHINSIPTIPAEAPM